jgi:RimJ/RimL family protein N-acetyltransferase
MFFDPIEKADLPVMLGWREKAKAQHAGTTHPEQSHANYRAWIEKSLEDPAQYWFGFRDRTGVLVGVVHFDGWSPVERNLVLDFHEAPGGSSALAFRMLAAGIDLAFGQIGAHKLTCEIPENLRRRHYLLRHLGLRREGRLREQYFDGLNRLDSICYGLVSHEWNDRRAAVFARIDRLDRWAQGRVQARGYHIVVLSDVDSWLSTYIFEVLMDWEAQGHNVRWLHDPKDATAADFCFCLSLGKLVPPSVRDRFQHTLVVHESHLPQGKGWSPLTWQILEGRTRIPVTLFEAADRVDSGSIYAARWIEFHGSELIDELRLAQARATQDLCRWFVDNFPLSAFHGRPQQGEESFYPRRRPEDSRLDPDATISDQFNLLRVVDNERYPAFFEKDGCVYRIKIERI